MSKHNPNPKGRPKNRFVTTKKKEPTVVKRIPVSKLEEVNSLLGQPVKTD